MSAEASGKAARLREIRDSDAVLLVIPSQRSALAAALERASTPSRVVVPMPRRGRMFVRHGQGPGAFSDVTLTSPSRNPEVPST